MIFLETSDGLIAANAIDVIEPPKRYRDGPANEQTVWYHVGSDARETTARCNSVELFLLEVTE